MIRFLDQLFGEQGKPKYLRAGNGREFIADTVRGWLAEHDVKPVHIARGRPQQNCYIERFNGTMRRDLLHGELFHSLLEARVCIAEFIELYNHRRPHRGLGMKTPAAYGKMRRGQRDSDSCEGAK